MNMNEENKMYGVVNGVYYCNMEKQNEINEKIYERNIPSSSLQPSYSIRPVGTKVSVMPIISPYTKSNVPCQNYGIYNIESTFNPGTSQAPWSGFSSNINTESILRNQFFGNQRCDQKEYVPQSNSDLYYSRLPVAQQYVGPNNLLFNEFEFSGFDPEPVNINKNFYHNHTRQQIKNLQ